jgi:hypothetical protein
VQLREEGRSPRCFIDYSIVLQLLIVVPVKEEGPSPGDFFFDPARKDEKKSAECLCV